MFWSTVKFVGGGIVAGVILACLQLARYDTMTVRPDHSYYPTLITFVYGALVGAIVGALLLYNSQKSRTNAIDEEQSLLS
jgi:hypothetical protein